MYIKRHKKNSLKIKRYKKRNIANRIFLFTTLFFFIIFLPFYFIFSRKSKRSNRIRKFSTNYSSIIQNKKLDYDKELYEFKSFSEYFEDFILYVLLLDIKNGFYIDIGAYDPNKVSVTKAFYLRGWNGINIEPLPNQFKLFEKERPKDINLHMVIGNNEGNVTFYVDGQCSTVQKKYAKRNESINIKMDTMSNICKKYVPEGKEVDFCKIDVEGNERDVLLGYDFDNYKPKVFCVESTIPLSFKPNYQLWEEILIKNGFTFVYERGVNRYYVNKKFSDILNRANNTRDYFRKSHVRRYK
jgi:FkbM family methyltransferase